MLGAATPETAAEGGQGGAAMAVEFEAYAAFERELIGDLIPFVEAHYSVAKGRKQRALAGLSMGGGQSLNFGLANVDTFAWVGGFSSAPNTKPPAERTDGLRSTGSGEGWKRIPRLGSME
jgi:enterochelin esterase-like enzyme